MRQQIVLDVSRDEPVVRYAGPQEWMIWLGLDVRDKTPFWQCEGTVKIVGKPILVADKIVSYAAVTEPCGHSTRCSTCLQMMEMLGRAWHMPSARKAAVRSALTAEMKMRVKAEGIAWPVPGEVHSCDVACKKAHDNFMTGWCRRGN